MKEISPFGRNDPQNHKKGRGETAAASPPLFPPSFPQKPPVIPTERSERRNLIMPDNEQNAKLVIGTAGRNLFLFGLKYLYKLFAYM